MGPLPVILLILLLGALNALIANKRKRSGSATFAWSVMPVAPVAALVTHLSGGDDTLIGWSAFLPPAVGLIAAISMANGKEQAARSGSFGAYVRCPFCAEAVRREAIKCRHCGSKLTPTGKAG